MSSRRRGTHNRRKAPDPDATYPPPSDSDEEQVLISADRNDNPHPAEERVRVPIHGAIGGLNNVHSNNKYRRRNRVSVLTPTKTKGSSSADLGAAVRVNNGERDGGGISDDASASSEASADADGGSDRKTKRKIRSPSRGSASRASASRASANRASATGNEGGLAADEGDRTGKSSTGKKEKSSPKKKAPLKGKKVAPGEEKSNLKAKEQKEKSSAKEQKEKSSARSRSSEKGKSLSPKKGKEQKASSSRGGENGGQRLSSTSSGSRVTVRPKHRLAEGAHTSERASGSADQPEFPGSFSEPSRVSRSSGRVSGLAVDVGHGLYSGSEAHDDDLVHPAEVYNDKDADKEGEGARKSLKVVIEDQLKSRATMKRLQDDIQKRYSHLLPGAELSKMKCSVDGSMLTMEDELERRRHKREEIEAARARLLAVRRSTREEIEAVRARLLAVMNASAELAGKQRAADQAGDGGFDGTPQSNRKSMTDSGELTIILSEEATARVQLLLDRTERLDKIHLKMDDTEELLNEAHHHIDGTRDFHDPIHRRGLDVKAELTTALNHARMFVAKMIHNPLLEALIILVF